MKPVDAGRAACRRDSSVDIDLGLVGVPTLTELAQTANAFEFDIDPKFDYDTRLDIDVSADIDTFCANLGAANSQSLNDCGAVPNLASEAYVEPIDSCQASAALEQYDSFTYDPTDFSLFPIQQNFECPNPQGYPEPQGYYSAPQGPYYNNGVDDFAPPIDAFVNLGLTAIPGNDSLLAYEDIRYPPQQYECLPESWVLPVTSGNSSLQNAGHVPIETSVRYATNQSVSARAATTAPVLTLDPSPSSINKSLQGIEFEISSSDTDGDYRYPEPKTIQIAKRKKREQRRKSSLSSACTSAGTPTSPVKYFPGEKPKKHTAKSWIRINSNTEGDTRTAKINNWKNKYEYKPLPLGDWTSGKHTFKYTNYENVDFLIEAPMSTRKIQEYIMKYPCDDQKRLILWIQKMPADQGRRYGSQQHSKCAFKECPIQRYITGTISTGEYRVAFDEKHFTYGDKVDPFDCTAYAHLYCMEQFLDFEQVCQAADVRVDTRLDLPLEPNKRAAFTMIDVPARAEMERFVKLATKCKLRTAERWYNYPFHSDYDRDQQKPHERTLTYLAHCMYEEHQDDSHKKQAALRRVTVSQRRVHLGDLEMSVADKRIKAETFKRRKQTRDDKYEDYYDGRTRHHIKRAEEEAQQFLEEKQNGKKRKARVLSKKGKMSKIARSEESDERDTHSTQPRMIRVKKPQTNYTECATEELHQYDNEAYRRHHDESLQIPDQSSQQLQTYKGTTYSYVPQLPLIDPTLDTPYGLYAIPATPKLNIEDFDNFSMCEDDLLEDNLEKLLSLERRQSSAGDSGPTSILKSPGFSPGRTSRRAIFGTQPVTDSKEYGINDPPRAMCIRRSGRIRAQLGRLKYSILPI